MSIKTTFKFNELSDDAKEKARQDYRKTRDYYFESEFVSDDMKTTLDVHGFELEKKGLQWDLSCSQSDFVGIDGKIKEDKLHELMMEKLDKRDKKKYYFWVIHRHYIEIIQNISHHHYYGQQVDVTVEFDEDEDVEYYVLLKNFADKLEKAEEIVKEYIDDLIRILKKQGYEQLRYYDSDEYIDDYFINSDCEFDEDGNSI
jgi:hypothetical protein